MRRFLGTYYHTLDEKGRLSIPSRYRKDMGTDVIITRGHEGCLYLWPLDEWETQAEELLQLRQTSKDPRDYMRNLAMNADEGKIDSHGRIIIPAQLRALAGLEKDVVIGGVVNHLELWSPERLEEYWSERAGTFEDTSERLYATHIRQPEAEEDTDAGTGGRTRRSSGGGSAKAGGGASKSRKSKARGPRSGGRKRSGGAKRKK